MLALTAFPHALLPNPLVAEIRTLAKQAELELPLVEEVAADIFMGTFTTKWRDALDGDWYDTASTIATFTLSGSAVEVSPSQNVIPNSDVTATVNTCPGTGSKIKVVTSSSTVLSETACKVSWTFKAPNYSGTFYVQLVDSAGTVRDTASFTVDTSGSRPPRG
jgi:hypothetical protein